MVGDFLSITTDGWFQTDGNPPDMYEMTGNGIWTEYEEMAEVIAPEAIQMDLALIYYLYRRDRR